MCSRADRTDSPVTDSLRLPTCISPEGLMPVAMRGLSHLSAMSLAITSAQCMDILPTMHQVLYNGLR